MGERLERWRTRLRSDRVENTFLVILLVSAPLLLLGMVGPWSRTADWSQALPWLALYVVISTAGGTAIVVLLSYWGLRQVRAVRRHLAAVVWRLHVFAAAWGLLFMLLFAPSFAETMACERGDGVQVQTSWTETNDNNTKSGVYTVDGETYDIVVNAQEYLVRQTAPEQPPSAADGYYVRTYRVPWVGSSMVCSTTPENSDRDDLIGMGFMGSLAAAVVVASLRQLWRRRRSR